MPEQLADASLLCACSSSQRRSAPAHNTLYLMVIMFCTFNDTVGTLGCTAFNCRMNDELKRIKKEAAVA
jgi:hypothetical protein